MILFWILYMLPFFSFWWNISTKFELIKWMTFSCWIISLFHYSLSFISSGLGSGFFWFWWNGLTYQQSFVGKEFKNLKQYTRCVLVMWFIYINAALPILVLPMSHWTWNCPGMFLPYFRNLSMFDLSSRGICSLFLEYIACSTNLCPSFPQLQDWPNMNLCPYAVFQAPKLCLRRESSVQWNF